MVQKMMGFQKLRREEAFVYILIHLPFHTGSEWEKANILIFKNLTISAYL